MATALDVDDDLTRVAFADIQKWEDGPDGTLYVYGRASTPEVDTDEQVVRSSFSGAALRDWLNTAPALRVQHNSQRDPAGSGIQVEVDRDGDGAHWVKAAVDEPVAQRLVKKGHLRAFSIGIAKPVIERDVTGKARGGIITGGRIVEVSLVDSPANRSCFLELAKADKSGNAEWSGKVIGGDDMLTKATPEPDTVTVDVPKSASITFSPGDLAKLLEHRRIAEQRENEALAAIKAAEAAVYKRDIDTATRRRLASQSRALPDGSYPIETHEDAHNAATLALSGHGDAEGAKRLIRRVARQEGWKDVLRRLSGKNKPAKEKAAQPAGKAASVAEAADEPVVKAADGDDPGSEDEPGGPLHHQDGQDDDTDSDADDMDKAAQAAAPATAAAASVAKKVPCPKCGKGCKPKARFCTKCGCAMSAAKSAPVPDGGAVGAAEHGMQPAPEHREPDGPAVESLEHDAGLPTVPDAQVKTAAALRALGVPWEQGWLHDTLCPAYDPAAVKAAWPMADLSMIDSEAWGAKALEIAATAPLEEARTASLVWASARMVKAITPDLAGDIMTEAHKAFRDANPGPGKAPAPGEISAQRYNRPYITEGHAAPSPGHDAPHKAPIHPGHISASDFHRDLITAGHQADSPGNENPRPAPVGAPEVPGVPSRVYYSNVQRQNAQQAMRAMHDHIAQTFPDLCPMHGPGHMGEPPSHARPVPVGVGGPVPHGASKSDAVPVMLDNAYVVPARSVPLLVNAPAQPAGAIAAKAAKKERRRLEKAALAGDPAAWEALGLTVPGFTAKSAAPAIDPDLIKSAITEATAPVLARLSEQDKMLAEYGKAIDAIADQPDPSVTAYRGVALAKTSAAPVEQPLMNGRAAHAQDAMFRVLYDQWRTSPSPEEREDALAILKSMTGLNITTKMT